MKLYFVWLHIWILGDAFWNSFLTGLCSLDDGSFHSFPAMTTCNLAIVIWNEVKSLETWFEYNYAVESRIKHVCSVEDAQTVTASLVTPTQFPSHRVPLSNSVLEHTGSFSKLLRNRSGATVEGRRNIWRPQLLHCEYLDTPFYSVNAFSHSNLTLL